jgi:hypothetical protein
MAVTLFMRVPELTLRKYDNTMLSLGLDANPPAGLILHAASEAVGAVNVMEIWQTPEAAEGFVQGRLREALAAQKVKDPLSYRIEPLYNLYACNVDMIERIGAMSLPAAIARTALVS